MKTFAFLLALGLSLGLSLGLGCGPIATHDTPPTPTGSDFMREVCLKQYFDRGKAQTTAGAVDQFARVARHCNVTEAELVQFAGKL